MKHASILTAALVLALGLTFVNAGASAAPYEKGCAPQIDKENQQNPPAAVANIPDPGLPGGAFALRPSLGIENGLNAAILVPERPESNIPDA